MWRRLERAGVLATLCFSIARVAEVGGEICTPFVKFVTQGVTTGLKKFCHTVIFCGCFMAAARTCGEEKGY